MKTEALSAENQLTFTDWYANEYRAGPINEDNYSECAAYLEGLLDAREWSEEAKARLDRCINTLRGGGSVIECLKRYGVKAPREDSLTTGLGGYAK